MLTLRQLSAPAVFISLAVVASGCAARADDEDQVEPNDTEEGVTQAGDPGVNAEDSTEASTEATSQAIIRGGAYRGGAYRGGAYRGGAYRGGAYRGGAYRVGTYRGGAVYGTGGVVYGAGGIYRAGRYSSGGIYVTCDGYGYCY